MRLVLEKPEQKFKIIYDTLAHDNNLLTICELCQIAGVSRSGYYNWVDGKPARDAREAQDRADFENILAAYNMRGKKKGAREIHMTLLHFQTPILMNVKKIGRLMRKYHLSCLVRRPNPYRAKALAFEESAVAPYILNRRFKQFGPRSVLLTDITYLIYADDRKCYMSVIIDAYTKQVLSYVISRSLEEDFVLETVNNLMRDHGVSITTETLINSDQGSHYKCIDFRELVSNAGLRQSMSHKATCWDNAPQESFFGHIKDEVNLRICTTFAQVKTIMDDEIDYYNNDRYQWELAKLSPNEFYLYAKTGEYPLPVPPPKKFQDNPPLREPMPISTPPELVEQEKQFKQRTTQVQAMRSKTNIAKPLHTNAPTDQNEAPTSSAHSAVPAGEPQVAPPPETPEV